MKTATFGKLGKREKKHLKEFSVTTLGQFKDLRTRQLEDLARVVKEAGEFLPNVHEPCWECKMMARKLGLETCESQNAVVEAALKEAM